MDRNKKDESLDEEGYERLKASLERIRNIAECIKDIDPLKFELNLNRINRQ